MDLELLLVATGQILNPWPFFLLFIGTSLGILVGAIPGMTGAMLIALTLPLTVNGSVNACLLYTSPSPRDLP